MKMSLTFENGVVRVFARAEDDAEKRILGVLACGDDQEVKATVAIDYKSHYSYEKAEAVGITLHRVTREGNAQGRES